jgi:CMP-2-keto-3-deoxyoctulosonic acid synthetase
MINFSDTKDEVVKIVTDRTAAAMYYYRASENDEKLSIAVFGTQKTRLEKNLKP